jgi:hypothetical protein
MPIECSSQPTLDCHADIVVAATPTADPNTVYFAKPRSSARWLGGTTLSPKSDPTDPLVIQSVAFGYNNKVANIVTGAGAGFTAGLSFGPAGAWGGLILGGAAAVIPTRDTTNKGNGAWVAQVVCTAPNPDGLARYLDALPTKEQLWLPVTVDYPTVDAVEGCWHALPGAPSAKASTSAPAPSTANTGWFYRVLPTDAKPAKVSAVPPVLASKSLQAPLPTPFAVAWWQDIAHIKPETLTLAAVDKVAKTLVVAAADPRVVQLFTVSSGTTVTLLNCGGFATPGAASTAVSDDISAVIKQAQAIKAAETPAGKK